MQRSRFSETRPAHWSLGDADCICSISSSGDQLSRDDKPVKSLKVVLYGEPVRNRSPLGAFRVRVLCDPWPPSIGPDRALLLDRFMGTGQPNVMLRAIPFRAM